MGKRVIQDDDYSPVKASLARYKQPSRAERPVGEGDGPQRAPETASPLRERALVAPAEAQVPPTTELREEPLAQPHGRLTETVRVRVSPDERELWHELSHRVTGKRNNLGSLLRAAWLLVEHAQEELEERATQMAAIKRPPKEKHLERALYEERLAHHLYDALRSAGRPQSHLLKPTGT